MRLKQSYPFDWQGLEDFSYDFDAAGVPRVDYGAEGLRYNPITIAQYGLFSLQRFAEEARDADRARALSCAVWLAANARPAGCGSLAWIYDFSLPFYGPDAPWISAMAQGEAVSLLVRCHVLEQRSDFLDIARSAIRLLDLPVAEGGTLGRLPGGDPWFEEYPTEPASHVFNGHLFALLGAADWADHSDLPEAWQRYERGLASIERNWRLWDRGFWTRYDLHPTNRLASRMYQRVHVRLMRLLAERTGRPLFFQVARRWRNMLYDPWSNLAWLALKSGEKIRLRGGLR
ncbi:MAG TPA: D-glucuronyl C5-epimerase family protein [bacterium]|nr:D-glucuronyl C5-epimerase family protein [bacterium]HPR89593.1 D-glucuronyl C5-epimerase family protein [bacterium]